MASSNNLKDHGVFIVTVGLGSSTSFDELRQIASSRSAIFILKDYKTISTYVDNVAESLCNGKYCHVFKRFHSNSLVIKPFVLRVRILYIFLFHFFVGYSGKKATSVREYPSFFYDEHMMLISLLLTNC